MLDLIELIGGILEAWYWRRFLAALAAAASLFFGISFLLDLPASADFSSDLAKGIGCIALAALLAVAAVRSKKRSS